MARESGARYRWRFFGSEVAVEDENHTISTDLQGVVDQECRESRDLDLIEALLLLDHFDCRRPSIPRNLRFPELFREGNDRDFGLFQGGLLFLQELKTI